jgi:hypothetical protein
MSILPRPLIYNGQSVGAQALPHGDFDGLINKRREKKKGQGGKRSF